MPECDGSFASSSSSVTGQQSTSIFTPSKGLSRIGPIKKLVHAFIAKSQLDISSLYISSPDEFGLCAKGKIRLSHLATGPIPLVGLKVEFKDSDNVMLYKISSSSSSSEKVDDDKKIPLAKVKIEPLTLQPGLPGSVSSEVDLKLILQQDNHDQFVDFIKDVVRSDPKKEQEFY